MKDVTYTTQETADLHPMDPIAEAETAEQQITALEAELAEVLLEQVSLEVELRRETADHDETVKRLNHVELALLALYQLYSKERFKDLVVKVDIDDLVETVKEAEHRYRNGLMRDQARERLRLQAQKLAGEPK